jgi:hypothetical protein
MFQTLLFFLLASAAREASAGFIPEGLVASELRALSSLAHGCRTKQVGDWAPLITADVDSTGPRAGGGLILDILGGTLALCDTALTIETAYVVSATNATEPGLSRVDLVQAPGRERDFIDPREVRGTITVVHTSPQDGSVEKAWGIVDAVVGTRHVAVQYDPLLGGGRRAIVLVRVQYRQ